MFITLSEVGNIDLESFWHSNNIQDGEEKPGKLKITLFLLKLKDLQLH